MGIVMLNISEKSRKNKSQDKSPYGRHQQGIDILLSLGCFLHRSQIKPTNTREKKERSKSAHELKASQHAGPVHNPWSKISSVIYCQLTLATADCAQGYSHLSSLHLQPGPLTTTMGTMKKKGNLTSHCRTNSHYVRR